MKKMEKPEMNTIETMDYQTQLVSSNSSYNFVARQLISTPQPDCPPAARAKSPAEHRQGLSILSIVLFITIFFGILTAFGVGLSSLGGSSNVSQTVSEYLRRLG
ncbi:MAG: hypothetical protein RIR86_1816 [Acidobacteriota bacterium]